MDYQIIQNFLSLPQLADIVSYIFLIVAYIIIFFVRKFVEKDNKNVVRNVDLKAAKLDVMQFKLESCNKKHEEERQEWKKEKQQLQEDIETLKKVVRVCCSNVKELVKSGISNKLVQMLPIKDGSEIKDLNTYIEDNLEDNNQETNMEE